MRPQPHFLTICWDGIAPDGTLARYQANLCKDHRQVIALECSSAHGVLRQFGESCDLCQGREPKVLDLEPPTTSEEVRKENRERHG